MREQMKRLRSRLRESADDGFPAPRLAGLRAAAAELLVATTIDAAWGRFTSSRKTDSRSAPRPLVWAPLLLAPLTAAAHVEHVRNPRENTATALRILNTATVAFGGALLLYELLDGESSVRNLGPLGLASAGALGFAIDAEEKERQISERELRHRASVVERLVPARKAKLDRVVVHV